MHALRRFIAILLMAVWLPAVMHCRLEAATGTDCCKPAAAESSDHHDCGDDICGVIEGDFTRATTAECSPPPPALHEIPAAAQLVPPLVLACSPPPRGLPEFGNAPPDLVPSRHFAERTALPARAPDRAS